MQFQVPQFIETEDKIIGSLTIKQFLYLAIPGIISFLLFFQLATALWLFITVILGSAGAALAFLKVNGRPLPVIAMAALSYYWKPRFYLWKRDEESDADSAGKISTTYAPAEHAPHKTSIAALWQQLTTSKTPIPKREKAIQPSILDRVKSSKERFEMVRDLTGSREVSRRVDYR